MATPLAPTPRTLPSAALLKTLRWYSSNGCTSAPGRDAALIKRGLLEFRREGTRTVVKPTDAGYAQLNAAYAVERFAAALASFGGVS